MEILSLQFDEVLAEIYSQVKSHLKEKDIRLLASEKSVKGSILDHTKYVKKWSEEVAFKDMDNPKSVSKIYVELKYFLNLKRDYLQKIERKPIELNKILDKSKKHIVVLGQPGAGKTTTMQHICQSIFHVKKFHPEYRFPILIRLRDMSDDSFSGSSDLIFDKIFTTLGLKISRENTKYPYSSISVRECVIKMLDALGVLVVLDGLDEINPLEKKERAVKEFEYLCLNLNRSRVILTSRVGDYNYSITNTEVYEISTLSDDQIRLFAKKWLGNKAKSADLYSQIQKSPFRQCTDKWLVTLVQ